MTGKTLGITVMPEWIQVEGALPVLDRLQRAGATAIATSPYVMTPAPEGRGGREPPADAGAGQVRLLDRPLWGRRELWVETAPSFEADRELYAGLRYQPEAPTELTRAEGPKVGAFIKAAKARGLEVFLQVQAAIPPGYRVQFGGPTDDDQPLLPNGKPVPGRVDKNGTLASPHIKAYTVGLLRDLVRAYPGIDGFRIDWPEYPPYAFDALFLDFSPHAMAAAARLGLDANGMRRDMLALRGTLDGNLDEAALRALLDSDGGRYALLRHLVGRPGLLDMLRLKRHLVTELLEACRAGLPEGCRLVPQAFPPPWSLVSGFDYAAAAPLSDGIGVKLYTMHWPMMLRGYGEALLAANPSLPSGLVARALVALLGTGDLEPDSVGRLHYPGPDEAHPAGADAQADKIRQAQREAGACPIYAFAHAYGPLEDVMARLRIAWRASPPGIWINRYGYLSDAKLEALRELQQPG
jgi:hypothetical protein